MKCSSRTSFSICFNGGILPGPELTCPEGTVCCADSNQCDIPSKCKVILPDRCQGKPNSAQFCSSETKFYTCYNGGKSQQTIEMKCSLCRSLLFCSLEPPFTLLSPWNCLLRRHKPM
jgi:hypothetical protein